MANVLYFIIFLGIFNKSLQQNLCSNKVNCSECIQEFGCVWCSKPLFETPCLEIKNQGNCQPESKIISPKSSLKILRNNELQLKSDPVQIKPQEIELTLRKGETHEIKFQYAQAYNVPIDLYFLMDQSNSMIEHKDNLAKLGKNLIRTMQNVTTNFRIGFGSFVDKVDLPYTSTTPQRIGKPCRNCVRSYVFKNHMSLSTGENFTEELNKTPVSGNLDHPEGGLEALMQVMVCKNHIGWRDNAKHLIVFSTDAAFHLAGDGKLSGIVEPNDMKCHMERKKYKDDLLYDYPSVSQINYIANEQKINIFFTVAAEYKLYQELKKHIKNSDIAKLEKNSEISNLVYEFQKSLSETKDFSSDLGTSKENIRYNITHLGGECKQKPGTTLCEKVQPGQKIDVTATIQPLACLKDHKIIINPGSDDEQLIVNLNVICDCNGLCEPEHIQDVCQNNGNLLCGTCECPEGYFGKKCECDMENSSGNSTSCIYQDKICSGNGICNCGYCKCFPKFTGKFCECDSSTCENGCNGNGICDCGICRCKSGWTGEACECSIETDACTDNGKICNDKGTCKCGKCTCQEGFYGSFCDECATCNHKECVKFKPCVECKVFNIGDYKDNCDEKCAKYIIETKDEIEDVDSEDVKICSFIDESGCSLIFEYHPYNNKIEAVKELKCPNPLNIIAWIGGLIASILIAGLLALIVWKLTTTAIDKKEYLKFEKQRNESRWNTEMNPLFVSPVSEFKNPIYGKDNF